MRVLHGRNILLRRKSLLLFTLFFTSVSLFGAIGLTSSKKPVDCSAPSAASDSSATVTASRALCSTDSLDEVKPTALFGDQIFEDKNQNEICIVVAKSVQDIDLEKSQDILVRSFMDAYEDVPLSELSPEFKSTGDVRRFYENYFKKELEHFKEGHLFWIQAFVNNKIVGWVTFELEPLEINAAYMNLLVVAPEYQKIGIGRHLTFSICSEELFPNVQVINLLIRKINTEGYNFYYRLGFFEFDYHRDNFVDTSLLTGLRWEKDKNAHED